jgi:hypothetical protein
MTPWTDRLDQPFGLLMVLWGRFLGFFHGPVLSLLVPRRFYRGSWKSTSLPSPRAKRRNGPFPADFQRGPVTVIRLPSTPAKAAPSPRPSSEPRT